MRLFLFSVFVAVIAAQQDVCQRHQHQTCIIDSKLYIDGGKVYYGPSVGNRTLPEQNKRLLWENVLATDAKTNFPKQYQNLTKDPDVPSVSGGVLWPDTTNKLFYLFGGEFDSDKAVQAFTKLWFFDVIYNTWNYTSNSNNWAGISWPAFGAGAVTETGTAYYYGGYLNNKTTPRWGSGPLMLPSLTSLNMNTQAWSNRTYDPTPRAEGTLHYLPSSAEGLLVYLGGVEMRADGSIRNANMSVIQMFDIGDEKWFTQIASGDVPSPRRGACADVIWADDRSSYNLYVWGGIGDNGVGLAEVYVLTLPSFQWKLLWPEKSLIPHTVDGRGWSSCNIVRNSQMIIMGGFFTNTSSCDVPEEAGQHGLLLGQESTEVARPKLQWWWQLWAEYNRYRVPDTIVSLVGGNTEGHATRTEPVQGWATPSLAAYFKTLNYDYVKPRTATRAIPETPTAASSGREAPSGPNVGAIAGGTVGGVIALVALIAVVLFCLCRHRKQAIHNNPKPELDGSNAHKSAGNYTTTEDTTVHPSMTPTPAYSPQVSPQPGADTLSSQEWIQQGGYASQQPYYASPAGLSTLLSQMHPLETRAELPGARSPIIAELSDTRSPDSRVG